MKRYILILASVFGVAAVAVAEPAISVVVAKQHYPWDGKLSISYTANGVDEECKLRNLVASLKVFAVEQTTHVTNMAETAYLAGDTTPSNGIHKLVWDINEQGVFNDLVSSNFEVFVSIEAASKPLGGVQLWKDGPYWAECNVGATKPEESGFYFWWGDAVGYKRYGGTWDADWPRYTGVIWVSSTGEYMGSSPFTESACATLNKDSATLATEGYINLACDLVSAYDAATVHIGAPWRMPKSMEIDALVNNCTTTWITTNGVAGQLVTGKGDYAAKRIFLPAAGDGRGNTLYDFGSDGIYWSSTSSGGSYFSTCLYFSTEHFYGSSGITVGGLSPRRFMPPFVLRGFEQLSASKESQSKSRTA